ncbi:hypothetical protein WJX73_007344 [Symbiochloris irregularis]|uniref:MRPL25 domain-containing protein n=1 Tax=Symbiochloris irregularis TaxID=706552 RepID=A0AAW1PAD9_9CHLO
MSSARRLLERLGKAALQPSCIGGFWRKAAVSPRLASRLRRQDIIAGRDWPYSEELPAKRYGFGLKKGQPKGHKWQKAKEHRLLDIEKKLQDMPEKIAAYREHRKLKDTTVKDMLQSTNKERRLRQYRLPK